MIQENSILEQPSFKQCEGKLLCQLIGGSTLYGLNTPESDIDYRGLFLATNKTYTAGFNTIESIVQTSEIDSTYYELTRYLQLLRKSNTQVMEILFAPKTAFTLMSEVFEDIKTHRYSLINSAVLKSSLKGYVFSEIRLATGERTGQLGGKRKSSLTKYGFSPKNFVQILRLCKVGIEFFKDGQYMVNVAEFDPVYHNFLMEIKTQPENFTCEQLRQIVNVQYNKLEKAMDESKIVFEFDTNLASDIVHCARKLYES